LESRSKEAQGIEEMSGKYPTTIDKIKSKKVVLRQSRKKKAKKSVVILKVFIVCATASSRKHSQSVYLRSEGIGNCE